MDGLVPGRIVYFVFDAEAASQVNCRRTTPSSIAERSWRTYNQWPAGAQAHIGPRVEAGNILPAMVTAVADREMGLVNLKVMLDGSDTYWATVVPHDAGKTPGTWHWMFEGQATRHQAAPAA